MSKRMDCAAKAGFHLDWMPLAIILAIPLSSAFGQESGLGQPSGLDQQPIEPILQKYCLGCHNQQDPAAGLSLQTLDALKAGSDDGPVLNRTNPQAGTLFAVLSPDAENTMPPADEPQPTAAERKRLKQWVMSGASIQSMAAGIPDVPAIKPAASHSSQLFSAALLPNDEMAVGGSRRIAIQNVHSEKSLRQFKIPDGNITSLQWAKNKRQLLAAASLPGIQGVALFVSPVDGSISQRFEGHTDAIYSAVISPDEKLVATAGYDRRILIHHVASGTVLHTLTGHNGSIMQLAFDESGNVLCSASTDGTVKVWNTKTGERLDTLSQPQGEQYAVQVGQRVPRIFAAGQDNRIRVWELVSKQTPAINPLLTSTFAHEKTIHRMTLSPDESHLATAAEDGTVRIWSTSNSTLTQIQSLPVQKSMVTALTFASGSRLVVTALDGSVTAYSISDTPPATPAGQGATSASSISPSSSQPQNMQPRTANVVATAAGPPAEVAESPAPNNTAKTAQPITLPTVVTGVLFDPAAETDCDCYSFEAEAGQELVLQINAARQKSPLDSHIQILTEDGEPILRTQLQAVRDSWFTFRGKNADQVGDFRLFNWREMELNEFLYADGEVVKLHHYPRGPDSGFNVYPGFGNRHTYFGTTATSHALLAPAFIVEPHSPDESIVANGLPVFPVFYENDDDGLREFGADSRLFFTPHKTGRYVVKVTDARDFSGDDFRYQLTVRPVAPSFAVTHNRSKLTVAKGTGTEIEFKIKRNDGFTGPVTIDAEGIPPGYICSTPVVIQQDQNRAFATLFATADASQLTADQLKGIRFVASSSDSTIVPTSEISGLKELTLQETAKLKVAIHQSLPANQHTANQDAADSKPDRTKPGPTKPATAKPANVQTSVNTTDTPPPIVLSIHPGETIKAFLTLDRVSHKGIVSFGKEDAGRNLPHGVFVDNIGLNGLLLLADQSDREFFITAAPVAEPGTYSFFLKSNVDSATSYPATLIIEP